MQGADTVLFSLCHGNNTKPNCPSFCLSTCIYFVFLFSFLSSACTVRFLGVRLSPSQHHSPLLEPIILSGQPIQFLRSEGQRKVLIYSLRQQHHTFTILFLRSHSRDFHSSICFPLSDSLLCTFSFFPWRFPRLCERGSCCWLHQHAAVWHIIWCSVPFQQDACLGA